MIRGMETIEAWNNLYSQSHNTNNLKHFKLFGKVNAEFVLENIYKVAVSTQVTFNTDMGLLRYIFQSVCCR